LSAGRYIVTGATGFLGGVLTRRLLASGYEVVAMGREESGLSKLAARGARAVRHDLASGEAAPQDLRGDFLIHCAALSSPWGDTAAFRATNVGGARSAVAIARAAGVRRFVHISTPSVYFMFKDQIGMREDAALPKPVNAYAASKREAEALVLADGDKLDPIILRPRGVYGAGDVALLPRLIRTARARALPLMRGGRAATDLTHVDDVVDAILAAVSARPGGGKRIFNISGGVALNVRQVIERAAALANVRVLWRPLPASVVLGAARAAEAIARLRPGRPEPMTTAYSVALLAFTQTLDITAARDHLGWRPSVSFEEGLARTFGAPP
jgi:nucleoside-diphosphate-sugar epimerase